MTARLSKPRTWVIACLVVIVAVASLAATRGADTVDVVQDRFPDVDVAPISDGRVGSPLTEADLTTTAAFRAMCIRTLAYVNSTLERSGADMTSSEVELLSEPSAVMRNFDQQQSAAIFEGIVDSLTAGEVGVAADFAANQCDGSGTYLDQ